MAQYEAAELAVIGGFEVSPGLAYAAIGKRYPGYLPALVQPHVRVFH